MLCPHRLASRIWGEVQKEMARRKDALEGKVRCKESIGRFI
jgi:hypothetical protein